MPFLDRVLPRLDRVDRGHLKGIIMDLVKERDFLERVMQIIDEGVVVTDRDGRIRFANRAAERLLAEGTVLRAGHALREAVTDSNLRACIDDALGGRVGVLDREVALTCSPASHISLTAAPIEDSGGKFDGIVFTLRNITIEMMKRARHAWMRRLQSFSIMAAGIAHELGNPLNSLDIHMQLIERKIKAAGGGGKNDLLELLAVAREEIGRLEAIVGQFLRAARKDVAEMREGDIIAVLSESLAFMEAELQRSGVSVVRKFEPFVPPVLLNADQMRQVFINLVRNAIQAMPRGGILRVEVAYARGQVEVRLTDSGAGIPEDHIDKIFEPYFTTKHGGSGLGLTIVQRIVSDHGGEVSASSAPGEGTTMTVRIPVPGRYARLLPDRSGGRETAGSQRKMDGQ